MAEPDQERPAVSVPVLHPEPEHLHERLGWLLRLRAVAVVAALAALAAAFSLGVVPHPAAPVSVAVALGAWDLWAWHRWRSRAAPTGPGVIDRLHRQIGRELVVDLLALGLLLHMTGGALNPFATFYAFHMAIGAMVLDPRRSAYLLAVGATSYTLVVMTDLIGVLPRHEIHVAGMGGEPWRSPIFVLWRVVAVVTMMAGIRTFVGAVTARLRRAEAIQRERERVAQSRERFVRVGEIAAGVAHAVRNPLHGLISSVDLLEAQSNLDAPTRTTLSMMAEALQRIDRTTRRLLVLTRDAPLTRTSVDVDSLVHEAVRLSSPRARGSAAELHERPGGAGAAEVDGTRLVEALVNVIDNAVDACRTGGAVTVATQRSAPTEEGVWIEVRDTGPGMTPEVLRHVFDPFFTTKPIGEGTGLGLAIARRVLEEHGGHVEVVSQPGQGTTVRMRLPRSAPEELVLP